MLRIMIMGLALANFATAADTKNEQKVSEFKQLLFGSVSDKTLGADPLEGEVEGSSEKCTLHVSQTRYGVTVFTEFTDEDKHTYLNFRMAKSSKVSQQLQTAFAEGPRIDNYHAKQIQNTQDERGVYNIMQEVSINFGQVAKLKNSHGKIISVMTINSETIDGDRVDDKDFKKLTTKTCVIKPPAQLTVD